MVRFLNWPSALAVAVLMACSGARAQAQLSGLGDEPPAPIERFNSSADEYDSDDSEMADDSADEPSGGITDADEEVEFTDETPRTTTAQIGDNATEVINERFPNGRVRIEREVTQDAQGNYVNHGKWRMWDERGIGVAEGVYENGKRSGVWVHWYRSISDAKLLSQQPYQQFIPPFASQATFNDGQLSGTWTIYDGKQRKISQWRFTDGRRDGDCTWWYPNGRKMREIHYRDGDIDGTWLEWDPSGEATVKDTYELGRKLAPKTAQHTGGAKKSQGIYLFAREMEQSADDWWECKPQVTTRQGKDEKHGPWTSWYGNGQKQLEGAYKHDMQAGKFVWWHQNGQKALEGNFESGKQDGTWTWWYASGQKSIQGHYAQGNPTGRWTWWKEDGKVTQSADLSHSEGVVIESPAVPNPQQLPKVKTAKPQTQTLR